MLFNPLKILIFTCKKLTPLIEVVPHDGNLLSLLNVFSKNM